MGDTTNLSSIARGKALALSASYTTTMGRPVPVGITAKRSPVRGTAQRWRVARCNASLSVRYRLSRVKIQEFLKDWAGVEYWQSRPQHSRGRVRLSSSG